ncbi:methylcobalamin:coenzyme M methyltransferase [Limihaloglobus sulfuriphilus]|uniref:Methylcobalamin:coenzyme M methyltransferase n=1 Tax=Limihaloglobus sulfuriphilus TaxID=1851148 RepID=A0A1Q2MFP2_9BACT|nr:uroporphyrinogen decarboxylase family protein [Limihaloglobus sulfuriphilus]AQQ71107.1 methylcobalamin:coenzyme M methyltransferase [Limihaloglobus sulfuriphilus]
MNLLNRTEVRKAIRFEGPSNPPRCLSLWHNEETLEYFGGRFEKLLEEFPDDVLAAHIGIHYWHSINDDPNYRWACRGQQKPAAAIDNCPIITDWDSQLDRFIEDMPDPNRPDAMDEIKLLRKQFPDRYILANWGHYFHQRIAYLRGIENLLIDMYDNVSNLTRLMEALLGFYSVWAVRSRDAGADGVWAGDDLGMQTSLFMSPDKFRQIYKPFYTELAKILHKNSLDFWLHSCGNNYDILSDLIEAGVDVFHPVQVGCMDARKTLENYRGEIAFWVGMDVQNLIPFGTPEQIKAGIRERAKLFYSPRGGAIYGAGNAVMANIPFENIQAYVETLRDFCENPA